MNRLTHRVITFCLLAVFVAACREEPVQPDLSDTRSSSEIMYDIPLNGGALEGRWTLNYEEDNSYVNDILVGFDSASYANGAVTVDFFQNGNVRLIYSGDTTDGTYTVAGSQLTLNLSSALHVTSFGISDNKMHWHYSAIMSVGSDIYRDDNDYLFTRY